MSRLVFAPLLLVMCLLACSGCGGEKEEKPYQKKGFMFDRMKKDKESLGQPKER
jgi:hypothetical protein